MKFSTDVKISKAAPTLALLFLVLFTACGDGDAGLSCFEVKEIVRTELAEVPAPTSPQPGVPAADAEETVRKVMAGMPQPSTGAELQPAYHRQRSDQ